MHSDPCQLVAAQLSCLFFFFNDTAPTEIYPLPLHDALPIFGSILPLFLRRQPPFQRFWFSQDRKSTRLNSSHLVISYAVFCLKKKKKIDIVRKMRKLCTLRPSNHHVLCRRPCVSRPTICGLVLL